MSPAGPRRRLVGRALGRVQRVGYRAFSMEEAPRLQITGYARNLADGRSVEVVAEADEPTLRRFVERLREGPPGSVVDDVEYRWEEPEGGLQGFEVRY
ncbi:MAG: acylphosphatase [Chloroflexi bacterium]|nr:acylphosphatase [Chloroflexota bacterium]